MRRLRRQAPSDCSWRHQAERRVPRSRAGPRRRAPAQAAGVSNASSAAGTSGRRSGSGAEEGHRCRSCRARKLARSSSALTACRAGRRHRRSPASRPRSPRPPASVSIASNSRIAAAGRRADRRWCCRRCRHRGLAAAAAALVDADHAPARAGSNTRHSNGEPPEPGPPCSTTAGRPSAAAEFLHLQTRCPITHRDAHAWRAAADRHRGWRGKSGGARHSRRS